MFFPKTHFAEKGRIRPEPRSFWETRENLGNRQNTGIPDNPGMHGSQELSRDNEARTWRLNEEPREAEAQLSTPADSL